MKAKDAKFFRDRIIRLQNWNFNLDKFWRFYHSVI